MPSSSPMTTRLSAPCLKMENTVRLHCDDFIHQDSLILSVKKDKTTLTRPIMKQFINDLQYYSHPYSDDLNYITEYFVYTAFDNENILEPHEKSWKKVLSKDKYKLLKNNNRLILGYIREAEHNELKNVYEIYVDEKHHKKIKYITHFGNFTEDENFYDFILDKYEDLLNKNSNNDVYLFPIELPKNSHLLDFWRKVFCDYYNINNWDDLVKFVTNMNMNTNILSYWENLYEVQYNGDYAD